MSVVTYRVVGLFPSLVDARTAQQRLARHRFKSTSADDPGDLGFITTALRSRAARARDRLGEIAGPEAAGANLAAWCGVIGGVVGGLLAWAGGLSAAAVIAVAVAVAAGCWLVGLVRASTRLSQRTLLAFHRSSASSVGVTTSNLRRRLEAELLLSRHGARFIRSRHTDSVIGVEVGRRHEHVEATRTQ